MRRRQRENRLQQCYDDGINCGYLDACPERCVSCLQFGKRGLQRAVPRHQLKALDTGTSIDPYFSLENSGAMRYYVDSYCHVNSLQGSRSPIGHTAAAIRTSKARFVNSQTFHHHEQNANISSNCLSLLIPIKVSELTVGILTP
jgi:hypothetical protein